MLAQQAALFVALTLRPLAIVFATQPFAQPAVPAAMRLGLSAALALLLLPGYAHAHPDAALTQGVLVSEPLVGLILAFSIRLAFAAVELAGELLDVASGLGTGQVLDPVTGSPAQVLSGLQNHLALVLYLSLGGHRSLLAAVAESYQRLPLGALTLSDALTVQAVDLAGNLFGFGLRIALPVLAATTLTSLALAAATRAFPEANAFSLGVPVKLAVALITAAAVLPLLAAVYGDLFASAGSGGARLLDLLAR